MYKYKYIYIYIYIGSYYFNRYIVADAAIDVTFDVVSLGFRDASRSLAKNNGIFTDMNG